MIPSVADLFQVFCRTVLLKYAQVLHYVSKGVPAKMALGFKRVITEAVLLCNIW